MSTFHVLRVAGARGATKSYANDPVTVSANGHVFKDISVLSNIIVVTSPTCSKLAHFSDVFDRCNTSDSVRRKPSKMVCVKFCDLRSSTHTSADELLNPEPCGSRWYRSTRDKRTDDIGNMSRVRLNGSPLHFTDKYGACTIS